MKRKTIFGLVTIVSSLVIGTGVGFSILKNEDLIGHVEAASTPKEIYASYSKTKISQDGEFIVNFIGCAVPITFRAHGVLPLEEGMDSTMVRLGTGGYIENVTPMQNINKFELKVINNNQLAVGQESDGFITNGFLNDPSDIKSGANYAWTYDYTWASNLNDEKPSFVKFTAKKETQIVDFSLYFSCEAVTGKHAAMPEKYKASRELKLVGSMNGWDYSKGLNLYKNPANSNEHMISNVYLPSGASLKVCEGALTHENTIEVNTSDTNLFGYQKPLWMSDSNDKKSNINVDQAGFYSFYVGNNASVWIVKEAA